MAELHKFRDDVRTKEDRCKPVKARYLDENFTKVNLKLSDSLKTFLKIVENTGAQNTLDFVTQPPSAESIPVFVNGRFSEWKQTGQC